MIVTTQIRLKATGINEPIVSFQWKYFIIRKISLSQADFSFGLRIDIKVQKAKAYCNLVGFLVQWASNIQWKSKAGENKDISR